MRRAAAIPIVAFVFLLAVGCAGSKAGNPMLVSKGKDFVLKGVSDVVKISQITGAESPNQTDKYAVYGTDLGSMVNAGDRTYFVFGDTFGERPADQIGGGGSFWRSNTMGYTTDDKPEDGITLDGMIVDDIGLAVELLPSTKVDYDEMTKIPTHGVYANGALYLYYMSVNHWGDPGKWDANYSGIGKSTDDGKTWTLLDSPKWPGDSGFVQVAPYRVEGKEGEEADIYFWGIPSGRFGGAKLMKVKESRIESAADYSYYSGEDERGNPVWSPELGQAKTVVDDTVGELSVVWNPYLERWIMTYLKEGTGVVIREGLAPWGPWGEPIDLVTMADQPGLYGPFMNDRYTAEGGRTIYFTLSLWDPYNVFWFKASLNK